MTITRYNFQATDILRYIKGKLKETTGVEVFCGERPTNNSKQRSEMLVVSLPYSIRQMAVYQETYLRISVIVKDKSEGMSNLTKLEELSNKIIDMCPLKAEDGRWYTNSIPALVLKGKDTIGYTIWTMQCPLIVNKTDTYNI